MAICGGQREKMESGLEYQLEKWIWEFQVDASRKLKLRLELDTLSYGMHFTIQEKSRE